MRNVLILVAGLLAGSATLAYGQTTEERAVARATLTKRSDAIVTLLGTLHVRTTMDGQQVQAEDQPLQATATVLDATGLAVVSLSAVDPGKVMTRMASRGAGPGRPRVQIVTAPTGLRFRLANGTEIPAQIAVRDDALDLAFLRPTTAPTTPVPFVEGTGGKVGPLDLLILLQRLGAFAGWKTTAAFAYVETVIDDPRTSYLIGAAAGLGSPAFDLNGGFVGIVVLRSTAATPAGPVANLMADLYGGDAAGMTPVVLPVAEIRAAARNVR